MTVVCGEPQMVGDRNDTLANPTLIAEVLSPSTEAYDRGFKFSQYRTVESLKEYVLVSQTEARVEVFRREAGGHWLLTDFVGLDATCRLETGGCRIALADIYNQVSLDAGELR